MIETYKNQVVGGENDGMVAHMNFRGGNDAKLWGNEIRSTITQPPVALSGFEVLPAELQRGAFPAVEKLARWWLRERLDADGLPFLVHPWESGRDAGRDKDAVLTPYLATAKRFLDASPAEKAANPTFVRLEKLLDLQTINPGTKDLLTKVARFALLADLQTNAASSSGELNSARARQLFSIKTPDTSALLIVGLRDAAKLARATGEPGKAQELETAADTMARKVNEHMWGAWTIFRLTHMKGYGGVKKADSIEGVRCEHTGFDGQANFLDPKVSPIENGLAIRTSVAIQQQLIDSW